MIPSSKLKESWMKDEEQVMKTLELPLGPWIHKPKTEDSVSVMPVENDDANCGTLYLIASPVTAHEMQPVCGFINVSRQKVSSLRKSNKTFAGWLNIHQDQIVCMENNSRMEKANFIQLSDLQSVQLLDKNLIELSFPKEIITCTIPPSDSLSTCQQDWIDSFQSLRP